jgi:hypothetical protein
MLALALAAAAGLARGASLTLGEGERAEAVRVGQRSVTQETFGAEWQVVNPAGERVTVVTPFYRLAVAARHAAFKNEPFRARDQERALAEVRHRLRFIVELRGGREDFARHYTARLRVGGRELLPTLVQNEHTAWRGPDGVFHARCEYWFPTADLTGRERITLDVADAEGRLVTRFVVDLARMR